MKLNMFGMVKDWAPKYRGNDARLGFPKRKEKDPELFGPEMPANATDFQRLPREQNRCQLVVIATNINLLATGICFDSRGHEYLLKSDQQWQRNASTCQVRVLNTIDSR